MDTRLDVRTFPAMVRLLEELVRLQVPVVFKGAVVLKIATSGPGVAIERATKDIDMDLVGPCYTMDLLLNVMSAAARNTGLGLTAKISREFAENRSAGLEFYWPDGTYAFGADVGRGTTDYCCAYRTSCVMFVGSSPQKMLFDKSYVLSTTKIMCRAKDLIDLYRLSYLHGYKLFDLHTIEFATGRRYEDFNAFRYRLNELQHEYDKLRGVYPEPKPDFDVIYSSVYHFVEPLILGENENLIWDGHDWVNQI